MKNGEAGFELLINNLEFMFYIHTRRPDPDKYRDIHTPLHFRLLFQEEGTYQKKLYIKTFLFPSTNRGHQSFNGRISPSKQNPLVCKGCP